jgi:hypothetical protein
MEAGDRADFAKAITAMVVSFGKEGSPELITGYWMGLCDLDILTVQRAVARAIREFSGMPKPADLRKLSGASQSAESLAELAWVDVIKAIPYGPYKHVDFEDSICNAVIRSMGGWPNFISRFTDAEAENWVRKEFTRMHQNLQHSGVSGEMVRPLAGLSNCSVINGMPCEPVPIRIECEVPRPKARIGSSVQSPFARIEA